MLAKIAELPESDRAMGERLHAVIKPSAPDLAPRLWYGMYAYAKDGKVVCFFQSAQKFKTTRAVQRGLHHGCRMTLPRTVRDSASSMAALAWVRGNRAATWAVMTPDASRLSTAPRSWCWRRLNRRGVMVCPFGWSSSQAYAHEGFSGMNGRSDWTANQWNYDEVPGGPSGAWNNDGPC